METIIPFIKIEKNRIREISIKSPDLQIFYQNRNLLIKSCRKICIEARTKFVKI